MLSNIIIYLMLKSTLSLSLSLSVSLSLYLQGQNVSNDMVFTYKTEIISEFPYKTKKTLMEGSYPSPIGFITIDIPSVNEFWQDLDISDVVSKERVKKWNPQEEMRRRLTYVMVVDMAERGYLTPLNQPSAQAKHKTRYECESYKSNKPGLKIKNDYKSVHATSGASSRASSVYTGRVSNTKQSPLISDSDPTATLATVTSISTPSLVSSDSVTSGSSSRVLAKMSNSSSVQYGHGLFSPQLQLSEHQADEYRRPDYGSSLSLSSQVSPVTTRVKSVRSVVAPVAALPSVSLSGPSFSSLGLPTGHDSSLSSPVTTRTKPVGSGFTPVSVHNSPQPSSVSSPVQRVPNGHLILNNNLSPRKTNLSYTEQLNQAKNARMRLHELCQKEESSLTYDEGIVDTKRKDVSFSIICRVNNQVVSEGYGQSKKLAKENAAAEALKNFI